MGPTCGCGALACPFGVSATAGIIVSVYGYWDYASLCMFSHTS